MAHVVIVGGGIAGLATAYYLQAQARSRGLSLRYTLVERDSRFGGKIVTEAPDGFVIEGGPDSFITQKPQALALCRELGLSDALIGTNEARRKVFVLHRGRLVPLPDGVMLVVPTRFLPFVFSPLLSPLGKLRMGLDLLIPPRRANGDETLGNFIRRRLGREALEKIAEPLMAGIHVADAERLSLESAFPRFRDLEQKHGSLIRGMIASRRRVPLSNGRPPSVFMTLRGGLRGLVEAVLASLDAGSLVAGRSVTELAYRPDMSPSFALRLDDGASLAADAVVLATPAFAAARLVAPLSSELAQRLNAIGYVSTATVSLGFRRAEVAHPLEGAGFVVPKAEGRRLLACTWTSSKFGQRAPEGYVLLRCFVGGARNESLAALDDASLVELARQELRDIMGLSAEPVLARVYRWEKGNPQYDVGHLERVARLEALSAGWPGLFLTGSAYRGVGIPDCIAQGQETAGKVIQSLLSRQGVQP